MQPSTASALSRGILLSVVILLFLCMTNYWVRSEIKFIKKLHDVSAAVAPSANRNIQAISLLMPPNSGCVHRNEPSRITGPRNGVYFDVMLSACDDWRIMVVNHWKATHPPGTNVLYPELAPEIFFHGRASDPFTDLARDGYLHDTGQYKSLWTVGMTDYSTDISLTSGPVIYRYLVVFKLIKPSMSRGYVTLQRVRHQIPRRMEKETRIIGRVWKPVGALYGVAHPDAYIFTREAQKIENNPLAILRIYRYHLPLIFLPDIHDK